MKRAFVGLSSPVGFDYANQAPGVRGQLRSAPNPLLDSPWGLLILFDEIVFLSRALCPRNMRDLPYVSFLDEGKASHLPTAEEVREAIDCVDEYTDRTIPGVGSGWYTEAFGNSDVVEGMDLRPASTLMQVGQFTGYAKTEEVTVALDMLFMSKIDDPRIELITNSLVHPLTEYAWQSAAITEKLVIEGIPNYLNPDGPYHPVIEELRGNEFLADYRRWAISSPASLSRRELGEMKEAVESSIKDAQEKLFVRHLQRRRYFASVAEGYLGDLASIIFPAAGTALAGLKALVAGTRPEFPRWQGFVTSARRQVRKTMPAPTPTAVTRAARPPRAARPSVSRAVVGVPAAVHERVTVQQAVSIRAISDEGALAMETSEGPVSLQLPASSPEVTSFKEVLALRPHGDVAEHEFQLESLDNATGTRRCIVRILSGDKCVRAVIGLSKETHALLTAVLRRSA